MIGMQKIPDKSIDMILCDLPYGTTQNKWDIVVPLKPLWEQYKRVIKKNGAIVLFSQQPFTSTLILSNPDWFRYEWIWEKHQGTGFLNAKKMPLKIHENILVFYKNLPTYNPQWTWQEPYVTKREIGVPSTNYRDGKNNSVSISDGRRYPVSIQKFKNDVGLHPTQKPVALTEYLIKTYTNSGETVLDNCMGSGTTAIACLNTGRKYVGFEKNDDYYQMILERISEHVVQEKLFD